MCSVDLYNIVFKSLRFINYTSTSGKINVYVGFQLYIHSRAAQINYVWNLATSVPIMDCSDPVFLKRRHVVRYSML